MVEIRSEADRGSDSFGCLASLTLEVTNPDEETISVTARCEHPVGEGGEPCGRTFTEGEQTPPEERRKIIGDLGVISVVNALKTHTYEDHAPPPAVNLRGE